MSIARRFEDDRTYKKAVIGLIGLLVVAVVGFAGYYYFDRYYTTGNTPVVDREIARTMQMAKNDPGNPSIRMTLADLYIKKGAYPEAIAQYNEVLKIDDKNGNALIGLGRAYYRSGKPKEAAAAFEQVVELTKGNDPIQRTPAMASVYYTLGQIYSAQEDFVRAEGVLKKALAANRTDADTLLALAQVQTHRGNLEDAIELYNATLLFVPTYREAYEGLAKAYSSAGRTTEANYANAMVEYSRGSLDTAIRQLEEVVKAKPDFAEGFYGLGASYDKKGDRDKAIPAYQKAIELRSDYQAAQAALGRLGGQLPANATPAAGH